VPLHEEKARQHEQTIRQLTASCQSLRVTLASIGDAVITTDENGRCTYLNPVAEALTGWTNAEALGVEVPRVFHIVNEYTGRKVDDPITFAMRERKLAGIPVLTWLIAKDGSSKPVDDTAAPFLGADGQVNGAVLIFKDITQRRIIEAELAATNAKFEAIFYTSPVGMYLLDENLRFAMINNKALPIFDELVIPSGEELIGSDFNEIVHLLWPPDIAEDLLSKFRKTLRTGEPYLSMGFNALRVDKSKVEHYEYELHQIEMHNNRRGVLCSFLDVSEKMLRQELLLNSEMRYRRLFQSAKDGILILDAHSGKIIDANAFMSALVGMEPADLLGKELHEIGMFDDVTANKAAFLELQRNKYIRYEHLPVQNARGERVEVEFIANVYREGETLVAQCNVRDISLRVLLETKIKQQAIALAEESRRKDEFLAMLSHELRNPMAPIHSAANLLERTRESDENPMHKQARDIILRQVGNLGKLIDDLLEVSRVISGKISLSMHPMNMHQVLEHAVETVRPHFELNKHTVTIHDSNHSTALDGVWVNGDATRMEEILINLLTNASKYTAKGGLIEIWCEPSSTGLNAELLVRDNGVGIDAKLLPYIFDLFSQADRTLVRSQGGLGIGLSLAHRLVHLHGGTIQAFSPPRKAAEGSKGSEFIVRIPLIDSPDQYISSGAQSDTQTRNNDNGLSILVVDDNIDLVKMIVAALEFAGHTVRTANNGDDGYHMALDLVPDVILLDIGLPRMDGYEVTRRLRAAGFGGRIIAVTGYGQKSDITLAMEAGFDAHLKKPFDFDDLELLIKASK
jgi:PAS domain S-box-containing protein